MKKILSSICLLLVAVMAQAENLFSIDKVEIKPGEEKTVSVILTNEIEAKSAAIDIFLPTGLSFVSGDTDASVVFSDRVSGMMLKSAKIQTSGALRIGLSLGTNIAAGTGEVFTFKIKAEANAPLGAAVMTLSGMSLTNTSNTKVPIDDDESEVNIYNLFSVAVAANDDVMGSVEGGKDEVKSGTNTTVTATANDGYHFVNWTTGQTEVSTNASFTFAVAGDTSLVANFAPNQYTMTFVLDNGQGNVTNTLDYASNLSAPDNFSKEGYSFAGWNPEVPATVPVGNQTYTATWTPVAYTLTYDLAGGELGSGISNAASYTIESAAITLNNPVREGYTFAGWTGTDIAEASTAVTIAAGSKGNRSYTATWTVNQYTVTFVLNNGENDVVTTQNYGTELTAPANLQLTGYTFAGWDPEVPATIPAANETYTATWTPVDYTLTYDLAGGELGSGITNAASYTIESAAITLNNPVREGYTFAGWTGTDIAEATTAVTIAAGSIGNRSYTATWTVNQYTVTFVLGNGDDDVVTTQDYGTELTAPANLELTGYTFAGWDPEVPATIPASDETYTATWTPVDYTLSYDLAGGELGSGITNAASYTIESEDITLNNPVREGYTFAGWTGTDITEATTAVTIAAGSIGNRSYTATWTVNQYKMTFVLGNGENDVVITQDYGTQLTAPSNFQKTGFTFKGWSSAVPATIPAGDKTFTAAWTPITYTLTYDLAGGKLGSGITNAASYTIESGAITLKNPVREGYTFAGWIGTDIAAASTSVTIAAGSIGNRSYTAKWTVNQYKLTFILDNGDDDVVMIQDYGTEIIAPSDLEMPGYLFAGWSPELPATVPASDQVFTAIWDRNSYYVSWIIDEDTIFSEIPYGSEIEMPDVEPKEGFTFAGWDVKSVDITGVEELFFTALWKRNSYKVTWIVDGQSTVTEVLYEDAIVMPEDPEKNGYTFTGWTPEVAETMPAEDLTYTATWTAITAIKSIMADGKDVDVYDLRGQKMQLDGDLPAGIYIIGGKKVSIMK